MLGVFLAIGFELATGKNVFQQVQSWPWPTVAVFFLFTIATAVPVLKGVPRKGNGFFSSDAEIVNGEFCSPPLQPCCCASDCSDPFIARACYKLQGWHR